jgi:shikimate kinase
LSECIILFGFKAAGKTHLGQKLSFELCRPFIDIDQLLEKKFQIPIRALHQLLQEKAFRKEETEIIQGLKNNGAVIALGGGSILNPLNVLHLQTIGTLFYVDTPFEIIQERIFQNGIPSFLDPQDPFHSLRTIYEERKKLYESIPAKRLCGI